MSLKVRKIFENRGKSETEGENASWSQGGMDAPAVNPLKLLNTIRVRIGDDSDRVVQSHTYFYFMFLNSIKKFPACLKSSTKQFYNLYVKFHIKQINYWIGTGQYYSARVKDSLHETCGNYLLKRTRLSLQYRFQKLNTKDQESPRQ